MPRATINEVATAAGVSTATVSRVLNGHAVVQTTADKVWQAINKLNYSPNALTRGVFAGRSSTIGVIIRDLDSPFYLELMRGIDHVATAHESLVTFANTFSQVDREAMHVKTMDEQRVRGLILTTGPSSDGRVRRMAEAGTPCVIVARPIANQTHNLHTVSLDNIEAGRQIGEHLVANGRSSIGVITGGERHSQTTRVEGVRQALASHGIHLRDDMIRPAETGEAVRAALVEVLSSGRDAGRPVDAVVCLTGLLTRHVYQALSELGQRVPDAVALIAMDDFAWAEALGITVIAQPSYDMGREAALLIADGDSDPVHVVKQPWLVARESCGEAQFAENS